MKMQRGGNVFSFDLQCCWFTHDHGECILFYKGEVNMDGQTLGMICLKPY